MWIIKNVFFGIITILVFGEIDFAYAKQYHEGALMAHTIGSGAMNMDYYFHTLGVACENRSPGFYRIMEQATRQCMSTRGASGASKSPSGSVEKMCTNWRFRQSCNINHAKDLDDCLQTKQGSNALRFLDAFVKFACGDAPDSERKLTDRFSKNGRSPGVFKCFPQIQDRISNCVKQDTLSTTQCGYFDTVQDCYGKFYTDRDCNDPDTIIYMKDLFQFLSASLQCNTPPRPAPIPRINDGRFPEIINRGPEWSSGPSRPPALRDGWGTPKPANTYIPSWTTSAPPIPYNVRTDDWRDRNPPPPPPLSRYENGWNNPPPLRKDPPGWHPVSPPPPLTFDRWRSPEIPSDRDRDGGWYPDQRDERRLRPLPPPPADYDYVDKWRPPPPLKDGWLQRDPPPDYPSREDQRGWDRGPPKYDERDDWGPPLKQNWEGPPEDYSGQNWSQEKVDQLPSPSPSPESWYKDKYQAEMRRYGVPMKGSPTYEKFYGNQLRTKNIKNYYINSDNTRYGERPSINPLSEEQEPWDDNQFRRNKNDHRFRPHRPKIAQNAVRFWYIPVKRKTSFERDNYDEAESTSNPVSKPKRRRFKSTTTTTTSTTPPTWTYTESPSGGSNEKFIYISKNISRAKPKKYSDSESRVVPLMMVTLRPFSPTVSTTPEIPLYRISGEIGVVETTTTSRPKIIKRIRKKLRRTSTTTSTEASVNLDSTEYPFYG